MKVYLSYEQIADKLSALAPELRARGFDALVIVLRGGGFAGIHLAFQTGLPLYFLEYERNNETIKPINDLSNATNVLLIEDFAGSGHTLTNCQKYLEEKRKKVTTLTVVRDRLSRTKPDYICYDFSTSDSTIILPWERHRLNKLAHRENNSGEPDHCFERIYDLTSDADMCILNVTEVAIFLKEYNYTGIKVMNATFALSFAMSHPEYKVIYYNGHDDILLSASKIVSMEEIYYV